MLEPLFSRTKVKGKQRLSADPCMRVAAFMSGKGTNLIKILEREEELKKESSGSAYRVVMIFSNNHKSNAVEIGKRFDKPVLVRDMKQFYSNRELDYKDINHRDKFDYETIKILQTYKTDCIALTGYMSVASHLITEFLTVNVHPADLRIKNVIGQRKYKGLNAVEKAIECQEEYLRSTTHIVNSEIDGGQILMVGPPLKVSDSLNYKEHQKKLKEKSDHIVYPLTLELLAKGVFKQDKTKRIYLGNYQIPNGIEL